ncbi:MAG TPA: peptidoglycan-binding protein [Thermohalobaculum sp.]|nr:peptidoglycan-binding protein [Thermohalobaculum sp.]
MHLDAAVTAAAPGAPAGAAGALAALDPDTPALATRLRVAHLIGQCAHESLGFTRTVESLHYTTPERLMAVWPGRFAAARDAAACVANPQVLANRVYGGRMGNIEADDGWRYRGRGWLQLTGRANYRRFGRLLGLDLEAEPGRAAEPGAAWRIAALYLATRRRNGRTALEWADSDNPEMVTRIVNGGLHGLADRRARTAAALAALTALTRGPRRVRRGDAGAEVLLLQQALARQGFSPGALDGAFGPLTEAALAAFQRAAGLAPDGIAGIETLAALTPQAA